VTDVQPGFEDAQDVAVAQRIPGVDDGILTEADVHPGAVDLGHTGQPATLGIGIEAALQVDALGRAGNEVDLRHLEQTEQLGAVGVVVRAHRRGVAGGDAFAHLAHPRLLGEHFEKA